jgi:hypothetical protein
MKKVIVLAVISTISQTIAVFAGPEVSSKPPGFFRPNEFEIGAFGTYTTGVYSGESAGKLRAWGGGIDSTYWLPLKYAGFRLQGTGARISGGR